MNQDWILQKKESRRIFSKSTWVPLRASVESVNGNVKNIGYSNEFFGCGSVAFSPENREIAEKLSWMDIGLSRTIAPYAYEDGFYSTIYEYQYNLGYCLFAGTVSNQTLRYDTCRGLHSFFI